MNFSQKWAAISWRLLAPVLVLVLVIAALAHNWPTLRLQRDTLVIATSDTFTELDPSRTIAANSRRTLYCVYETLVRPGPRPGEVVPWLADSWQSDELGQVWTFQLHPGVLFHDGTELTAAVAVEAINRCWSQEGMRYSAFAHHRSLLGERGRPLLSKAQAVDTYTLRLELRKPITDFLEILAQPAMSLALVRPNRSGQSPRMWGTGPFVISDCRPQQRLVLRRFEAYWHHYPTWRNLVFWHIERPDQRRRELERGHVDIAYGVGQRDLDLLRDGQVTLVAHPGRAYWSLLLNCARLPFKDIRCRFGVQHAFNKARLVKRFLEQRGGVANACIPSYSWAYPESVEEYAYDLAKARSWLSKVYGRSVDRDIEKVELLYLDNSICCEDSQRVAQSLARDMNAVGIVTYTSHASREDFVRRMATGAFQAALVCNEHPVSDPDVEIGMQWAESDGVDGLVNMANFSSERLNQALSEARSSEDLEERRAAYARSLRLLHEGAAEVPLAWSVVVSAYNSELNDIKINRLNMFDLSEAAFSL